MSKYFFYAVGEIFLVVLGILIALQINNWNNDRIDRNNEKIYLNKLATEIAQDIQNFEKVMGQFERKEERLFRIIRIWQSENPVLVDSLQYINDFTAAGFINPWYNEPVTWTQLIQTGDLKLIQDQSLSDELFKYYNRVKQVSNNFLMYPMTMTNKAREMWHRPFIHSDPASHFVQSPFNNPPKDDVYERLWLNREEYLELYLSVALISRIQKQTFKSMIESGQVLLKKVQAKL